MIFLKKFFMPRSGQSSFRRMLLSRILLLSVPVLLAGEYVVYRTAQQEFQQTVRDHLTANAALQAKTLETRLQSLRSQVATLGKVITANVSPSQSPIAVLQQLTPLLPPEIQCLQLTQAATEQPIASTCPADLPRVSFTASEPGSLPAVALQVPPELLSAQAATSPHSLPLTLTIPVTLATGSSLHLTAIARFQHPEGTMMLLDQDGTILTRPKANEQGTDLTPSQEEAKLLRDLLNVALNNDNATPQLLYFTLNQSEWVAGYRTLAIELSANQPRTWTILSLASKSSTLYGVEGIKQSLFILTIVLLGALLGVTLFVARDLALPIEQLGHYARQIDDRTLQPAQPANFKVRELNQLAIALNSMMRSLDDRADELETAWQEAQVATQLKNEFLATTSHELRTPLNAIIGCIRLVRDNCCDSRQEELEFLQQADDSAIHLLNIINDLLDISKIEAGKAELNQQWVDVHNLCQQAMQMVQPSAEKKRITLLVEIEPRLDLIHIDERRVRQMLINLLSNAVKFTPESGLVKLGAWLGQGHQLEQENRPDRSPVNPHTSYLVLEVSDSGIGIPNERWHLLFRPFSQVDSSLTRKHEGTGLGLALTKRLAELHGGTLSFKSTPNQGSTFRIWLPFAIAETP